MTTSGSIDAPSDRVAVELPHPLPELDEVGVGLAEDGMRAVDLVLPDTDVLHDAGREPVDEVLAREVDEVLADGEEPARVGVPRVDGARRREHQEAGAGDAVHADRGEAEAPAVTLEVDLERAER